MLIPTKPQDVTWTDAQWRSIFAEGRDVLVSAAAGSGKTAVLIERLIRKMIRQTNPIDVDELLVVTFTNASAAEMRHRMAEALEKALALDPTSNHLRRQLSLLNKAQISTLHSFCLSIVKQYAYVLDLDPGFRLANDAEAALIRDDVLAEVLEVAYKADNPLEIYRLVDSFTTDRDDQMIETLIDKLHFAASVHPEPKKWLLAIPENYDVPDNMEIDDLPFIDALKLTIQHTLEEAYGMTEEMRQLALQPAGPAPYGTTVEQDQLLIAEAIRRISTQPWTSTFDYFQSIKFATAARIPKDTFDEELIKKAKDKRDQLKKRVNGVKDAYFTRRPERLLQEMRLMHPILKTLVELTLAYGEQYRAAKNERGIVDFSDLEHFALQILTKEENGQLIPSNIAQDVMGQFKEVLVDEYQDTNRLQETILQIVKTGTAANGNMFMVGDVKQSIYRFRLAEPMLFLAKYLTFTTEALHTGVKIDLNANFRSRPEILHATNFIFSQIMGERVGEIEYDEAAALKPGAPFPNKKSAVELTLLSQQQEELVSEESEANEEIQELEELKKSQSEARYIIGKIRKLMDDKTMVMDPWTKNERLLEYADIVILMRSMTWSADLTEEFKQAGIPLYANLSKGYFDALEVMIMLNTLRIVDNPYQDIPLASVLRAPFVGLTESELSQIRLSAPKEPFYEALKNFVHSGGSGINQATAEKLQRFFLHYEEWRDLARRGSLADLIWRIYMDTHYYEMVGAMPGGKQRQANLRALHDRSLSYEKSSFRGLFRFLRFIDRMKKRGDDLGTARAMSEKENVVRLMTIHSSKGLEFPYVFIAGLGRDFNQMDFNELYLFDQTFGLAVKAVDPEKRISYTSLPFLAIKEKKQMELKSEEMRVLYVAMTRAKEKLMLVATVKDVEKSISKWQDIASIEGHMLPEYVRSRAKGFLDWIGPAVARHHDFALWQGQSHTHVMQHPSQWSFESIFVEDLRQINALEEPSESLTTSEDKVLSKDMLSEVERRFNAVYSHERSITKRSKQSVSELKRLDQLRKEDEPEFFRPSQVQQAISSIYKRPAFLQQGERKLSSAEIGTAMHTAMQHVDIHLDPTNKAIEGFIHQLADKQLLTINEAGAIKVDAVKAFLHSPIASRLRQASQQLREVPFTYGLKDEDGDIQLLQGIADCLFQEADGEWILLDYKTDKIKGVLITEAAILREMHHRYGLQLALYQQAIENILSITIKEKILYLFDSDQTIVLED
ncbi:helicase-exonuclease AddAB subunit AddA [Paenisporosarcina antarctica]|uniref:ATP-dependent helicase/nuclease subunit A n=1 Tax=Paenisporosarcina antarctica TaxID=417367 RepID=A0A4P6ZYG5_9BACL|nr:helicase-exonuclease AddAB subunit AddA [Paenisporosarcina antarctica]QBP41730.1 helicase-exonuclease AddAB subunit AddA [Paenisporosarcina antarctica]